MKEIQILNNGDALYDIRRKINENFELVHNEATTEPLVSFGVNEGNETNGVADLIEITDDTLNFKVGGEYPNLVITSGDGVTTRIENVNPLHLQNLADGEYTVLVDGSNSNITNAEFYSQLLEPENVNDGDVWFNGESAYQRSKDLTASVTTAKTGADFTCMASMGQYRLAAGNSTVVIFSNNNGQTWTNVSLGGSSTIYMVGCVVHDGRFRLVTRDRYIYSVDTEGKVSGGTQVTSDSSIQPTKLTQLNEFYIVTCSNGSIFYSTNFQNWTNVATGSLAQLLGIVFCNSKYYTVNSNGEIYVSDNLQSWAKFDGSAIYATCIESYENNLLIGNTTGGIYVVDTVTNNVRLINGVKAAQVIDIAVADDNTVIAVGRDDLCAITNNLKTLKLVSVSEGGKNLTCIHNDYILGQGGLMLQWSMTSQWVPYPYIPIGEVIINGGEVTYFTTYPYNTNGLFEATSSTFGLLRTAAEPDELNCQCSDAVLTPSNLYNLQNFRLGNTEYNVDDKVGCPYHHNLQLNCTQAGTTAPEALNTKGHLEPGTVIEDGTVIWEVEELGTGSGGHTMFDTVLKDHILTYEESKGLALQGTYVYKEAIAGSRYGYPDFYNKCLEEYNESTVADKIYLKSNVTIQGTLADTQGILMGFGTTSYAKLPSVFNPGTNSWEFVTKIKTPNAYGVRNLSIIGSGITTGADYQGFTVAINTAGKTRTYISSNGTSWNIAKEAIGVDILATGTEYYIKLEFTGTSYIVSISTDGVAWSVQNTITSSAPIYTSAQPLVLGGNFYSSANPEYYAVAEGNIDLNYSYIKINDDTWWKGVDTLEYRQHSNGHRFYDITHKQYFDDIFETNGIAWLYGVDTENERIFLPRNNYFDQATSELSEVGKYVESGLPNITGSTGMYISAAPASGAFAYTTSGCSGANRDATNVGVDFDASRCSSIYGNSNTVQPNAVKKLLYICVGNTESKSTITDVVDVTTTENDTLPLGYHFYQAGAQPSVSYLKSEGQWNDGNVYTTFYNEFVNKLGQPFASGYVKEVTDEYDDYDLVINQDDITFRLPLFDGSETMPDYNDYTQISSVGTYVADKNCYVVYLSGTTTSNGAGGALSVEGVELENLTTTNGTVNACKSAFIKKGQSYTLGGTANFRSCKVFACKGNGSLYFKVANALQNLELLDAGEVLEAVNSVIPNNSSLIANYSVPVTTEFVSLTWNTAHQLPCDAVIIWGGYSASSSDDVKVQISYDNVTWDTYAVFDSGYIYTSGFALQKGVYIKGTGGNSYQTLGYMPLKGAI